ncbi:MAG: hypothetical protein IPH85_06445 [Ignavibacteria bacterium]|nr:hypothetical protein [Ignavibacteria bacterium]
MRSRLLLLTLLLCPNLQAQDNSTTTSAIHQLVGRWSVTVDGQEASIMNAQVEAWRSMPDGSLVGWSGTSHGTGIHKSEELALSKRSGTWTYEARVVKQNNGKAVAFACTKMTKDIIVFENPMHDFRQKIEYQFRSRNEIVVTVSGSARKFVLRFRRIPEGVISYSPLQLDTSATNTPKIPSPTQPTARIKGLIGSWESSDHNKTMKIAEVGPGRYAGTIMTLASDLKTLIEFKIEVFKRKNQWMLSLQRPVWNNSEQMMYRLIHSSIKTLIFQNHCGESPNQLHFEFADKDSILLSCDDVVGMEGESSGRVIDLKRSH